MIQFFRSSLSIAGAAALALTSISIGAGKAEVANPSQDTAKDLGMMGISLKDAIKPSIGIQGQTQGAGTPNQAGIGGFLPLVVGGNSVFFLDALANVNFSDFTTSGDSPFSSSIINTTAAGTTISTSSRLGYRWLNSDRSWMFGVNAGYDSRPMATGAADTGVNVRNSSTVFYQQVAAGLEAVSNTWNFNAYALLPIGTTVFQLNSHYNGGALDTYGLDVGYAIAPNLKASLGYYYQNGDLNAADGSGVSGRLAYNIARDLTLGMNYSYDQAFVSRVSADLKYRFGGAPKSLQATAIPVIMALNNNAINREVRVHDEATCDNICQLIKGSPALLAAINSTNLAGNSSSSTALLSALAISNGITDPGLKTFTAAKMLSTAAGPINAGKGFTLSEILSATGVGNLVDADMSKDAAAIMALQTRQQMAVQALSIANQAPQSLPLFPR